MTIAVCFNCGETKFGPWTACRNCGVLPETDHEMMVSLVLTDGRSGIDELKDFADVIRSGKRIQIDGEPSEEWSKAFSRYRNITGLRASKETEKEYSEHHSQRKSIAARDGTVWQLKILGVLIGLAPVAVVVVICGILVATGLLQAPGTSTWTLFVASSFPPTYVTAIVILLNICRFENQRWLRSRKHGQIGNNFLVDGPVGLTAAAGTAFYWSFYAALFFDIGWQAAVGLFAVSTAALSIWSVFSRDRFLVWLFATIAIWPCMFLLKGSVTWFGIFASQ